MTIEKREWTGGEKLFSLAFARSLLNLEMQNTVIRSEVSEVHFGLYSDEEIKRLSCCKIISPIAFDGLGNPLNRLFDFNFTTVITVSQWTV